MYLPRPLSFSGLLVLLNAELAICSGVLAPTSVEIGHLVDGGSIVVHHAGQNATKPGSPAVLSEQTAAATSWASLFSQLDQDAAKRRSATAFSISLFLLIGFAYRSQGPMLLALLILYIASVIACQLTMRHILLSFPHPVFMTALHFMASWAALSVPRACLEIASGTAQWHGLKSTQLAAEQVQVRLHEDAEVMQKCWQPKWYLRHIAPIGFAMWGTIAMNNSSLLYIGAGLNSIIGILTPLTTALLATSMGYRIASWAWCGMAVALLGDAIISIGEYQSITKYGGEYHKVFLGMMLSGFAMFFRSTKAVLQDFLMNEYGTSTGPKLQPLDIWQLQAPLLTGLSLLVTFSLEGTRPWIALCSLPLQTLGVVVLSCVAAVTLNIGGTFVIKVLGAPASQIAAKLSVLVTAALASGFMGEDMTVAEMSGALVVVLGSAIFERCQRQQQKESLAERDDASKTEAGEQAISKASLAAASKLAGLGYKSI